MALMVTAPLAQAAGQWYEGGTLHSATLKEWASATTQNKMATMADMVVAAKLAKRPMEVVEQSVRAASCIDEVASEKAAQGQEVATVAALCMMNGKKG
ncbi:Uncharacterised protein [Achromobacter sp. 2789STDY5608615]|uniref:hypothetical protein n=1 Tax=Achromobacter sp. 2789STDY5608615 TaxID=1806492 RepID=UPI0006C30ED7|nr:hypothetical protein [Achromobacter sp. 2789STDY5608615]CUK22114.1 Uncharacterised protein [Achromobacter sp. 2789STDY5608615]